MQLLILGVPGAGKGTVATILKERKHMAHISTGDLFRKHIQQNTDLGKEAQKYISKGNLVPDEITNSLVRAELSTVRTNFVLDGYPRDLDQARELFKILEDFSIPLDAAIYLDVAEEVVVKRLVNRRSCADCGAPYNLLTKKPKEEGVCDVCGGHLIQRADDNAETIRQRLRTYKQRTAPLIDFYRDKGILLEIDADKATDAIYDEICRELENRSKK